MTPSVPLTLIAALMLTACASTTGGDSKSAGTTEQMGQALTSPLNDLNLVRADIPEVLELARTQPYALPTPRSCDSLAAAIRALDEVLGADLDAEPTERNPSLIDRSQDAANKAAVRAVQSAAQDVIPYRGWVRRLTGAERYSNKVAASIAAGTVRRAYLKGLGQADGCQPPAAPNKVAP